MNDANPFRDHIQQKRALALGHGGGLEAFGWMGGHLPGPGTRSATREPKIAWPRCARIQAAKQQQRPCRFHRPTAARTLPFRVYRPGCAAVRLGVKVLLVAGDRDVERQMVPT